MISFCFFLFLYLNLKRNCIFEDFENFLCFFFSIRAEKKIFFVKLKLINSE